MEDLQGKLATKRLIKEHLTEIGDLLYFEGSLMTLFKNSYDNRLYLFDWAEGDDRYNRWLVYDVRAIDILSYINFELTHLDLIKKSKDIYSVDIDAAFNFHNTYKIEFVSIPESYLPAEHCVFDLTECPDLKTIQAFLDKTLILQAA
jgi:hypothetical protein